MKPWVLSLLLVVFASEYAASSVAITTTSLPNGTVNTAYSAVINASGGCTPYKWAIASGVLPAGVTTKVSSTTTSLNLAGTPTTAATDSFAVKVTGCGGHVSQVSYKVVIQATASSVAITTTSLPNGTVNTAYSAVINASGGCTPYKWAIASGVLPAGVTATVTNNTRSLAPSGTPTTAATYTFGVSVTGCGKHTSTAHYSVTIEAQPPVSFNLTVGKTGTGSGTVTSSPAGINCGTACSAGFTSGTVVPLTATPTVGTFTGWSGACSGLGICSVTMGSAKSVTAKFDVPQPHSVDLNWDLDSGAVSYSIYRGDSSSGPFALLASAITSTAYTDTTVYSGQTYYYVATTTDSAGAESGYSNVATAFIPTP